MVIDDQNPSDTNNGRKRYYEVEEEEENQNQSDNNSGRKRYYEEEEEIENQNQFNSNNKRKKYFEEKDEEEEQVILLENKKLKEDELNKILETKDVYNQDVEIEDINVKLLKKEIEDRKEDPNLEKMYLHLDQVFIFEGNTEISSEKGEEIEIIEQKVSEDIYERNENLIEFNSVEPLINSIEFNYKQFLNLIENAKIIN